jgi:hypothetical protein
MISRERGEKVRDKMQSGRLGRKEGGGVLQSPHLAQDKISGPPFCLFAVCKQLPSTSCILSHMRPLELVERTWTLAVSREGFQLILRMEIEDEVEVKYRRESWTSLWKRR